jgi:hypothetical protein
MTTLERASFNQTLNLSNVEGHPNKDEEMQAIYNQ